jgi:hypothetical protein
MKKVLFTESDLNRLVKKIINESPIPAALGKILRSLDPAIEARTLQRLQSLLKNSEIDNFIFVNGQKGSIRNGSQVLDNFINGRLTSKDSEKVFNVIFKTTEDPKEMQVMVDFLIGDRNFFLKHKGKTKEQLMSEFTPIYGQKQAQILSDKIIYKNLPKVVWSTFWEMNSEAWASPKLYQTFWKLLKNPLDQKAWGNLMRWFFTGTSRNIGKTFKDYLKLYESFGFSKSACWALARLTASIGLEALQRWVILSGTTTVIKSVVEAVRFQNTPRAEELLTQNGLKVVLDIMGRNWSGWDHSWFFPFLTIVPAVLRFGEGFWKSMSWGQIYEYVINNEYPLLKELISLESRIENKLPFVLS